MKTDKGIFIIGTDTGVGKTIVATSLLIALAKHKFKTVAIKPVASGCLKTPEGLRNNDALLLQKHATQKLDYSQINPFAFKDPIAPHIAAKITGCKLTVNEILLKTSFALSSKTDYVVIEGAGGLCVPLNDNETMLDLIKSYNYPVILVVGIKLGCINHSLLTLNQLNNSNIQIAGWVANIISPNMQFADENIESIKQRTKTPLLTTIPYQNNLNHL